MGVGAGLRGEKRGPLGPSSVCCGAVDNTSLEKKCLGNYLSIPSLWDSEGLCSGISLRAGAECSPVCRVARRALGVWERRAGQVTWVLVSVLP